MLRGFVRWSRGPRCTQAWYGCQKATVVVVNTPIPTGDEYENTQPYDGRGWCIAERRMASLVKDSRILIDLSKLSGFETHVDRLMHNGRAGRPAPMVPDAFRSMLEIGAEDSSIKFTNRDDVPLVARIYERAFLDEMGKVEALFYPELGWGDEDVAALAQALRFAHDKGSLANLEEINLYYNEVGDAGMTALSEAIDKGSLAALQLVSLDGNPGNAQPVKAACDARGITCYT